MSKIPIPARVYAGLERVRESGQVNMLDRPGVMQAAFDLQQWETVTWLNEHEADYARGVFNGFEPQEEGDGTDR